MKLRGANAIVTGASTGIGRVTAILLASKGANVWAAARDEARLETLAAEHPNIVAVQADLTNEDDRARLIQTAGNVDVLVNNAGIGLLEHAQEASFGNVRQLFELNLLALIDLTQRALSSMLDRERGHIVNIGSIGGFFAVPGMALYSASKFAVHGYTEGLRRELTGSGIKVSLIVPGPIKSEFLARSKIGGPATQPGALDIGLPPAAVARAICRTLRYNLPGYRTISVPRVAGMLRAAGLPGFSKFVDLATLGRKVL